MTLTPEQRDELRAKHAATRPGSWDFQPWGGQNQNGDYAESILYDGDGETMVYGIPDADGDLIVAMRNALPALLDALTTAEAARDTAERQVQAVRDALAEGVPGFHAAGVPLGLVVKVSAVRAACEGGGGA